MPRAVFISYASKDKSVADAVCRVLENQNLSCWMAPRDIIPGLDWSEAIIEGINESKVMVLIFSQHSNLSVQVKREVERAVHKRIPVIPFRIENIFPTGPMEYFLSSPHWLDAFVGTLEPHLVSLVKAVQHLLEPKTRGTTPATAEVLTNRSREEVKTTPHNLPSQLTPLLGRERETAQLRALLERDEVRLVTLTGPGGIGKTRLGLRVAGELLQAFTDGVYFVSLAATTDSSLVLATLAGTLKIPETQSQSLLESLSEYLANKKMFLLLDNFEQVLGAATSVSELLERCPDVKILATSRERLNLRGEYEVAVPFLTLPALESLQSSDLETLSSSEAVALFVERARASKSGFTLTSENAPAIAEICHSLDGLPLALELAAANIRLFSPRVLLDKLTGNSSEARQTHALPLLNRGAKDLPTRQQTLRSTIDWSYTLLGSDEQTLFRRSAVFRGGFTLGAMEQVCGEVGGLQLDVLDGLISLADKHLLRQEEVNDEPRFFMLNTIYEYARERVEAGGELEALCQAHGNYFLLLVEEAEPHLIGTRQTVWLQRLDEEHDNFRALLAWSKKTAPDLALRLVAVLWNYWYVRGHFTEGREHLSTVVAKLEPVEPSVTYAKTLFGLAMLAGLQGDYETSRSVFEACLEVRRILGEKKGMAAVLNSLGVLSRKQNDYALARAYHEEALAIQKELNDKKGMTATTNSLANIAYRQEDYSSAKKFFEESLAVWQTMGDQYGVAIALANLGNVAYQQKDFERAKDLYERSLTIRRTLGNKQGIASSLSSLANVAFFQGDPETAFSRYSESLAIYKELGDQHTVADLLNDLGNVLLQQNNPRQACSLYLESYSIVRTLKDEQGMSESLAYFGTLLAATKAEQACHLWGAAETLRERLQVTLSPSKRAYFEPYLIAVREQLGVETFSRAWQEGRTLPLEEAVKRVLEYTSSF